MTRALREHRGCLCRAAAVGAFVAVLALTVCTGPARSHHWYEVVCCSDKDCAPIADDAVKATPQGWFLPSTGETLPYNASNVKRSQDERFHRCVATDGSTRCIYVPGMGA